MAIIHHLFNGHFQIILWSKKIEWETKYSEKDIQFKVIEDILWMFDKSSNNNPRNKILYIVSVFTTASILMYLLYFLRNSCSRMVLTRNNSYLSIFIFQKKDNCRFPLQWPFLPKEILLDVWCISLLSSILSLSPDSYFALHKGV